MRSSPSPAAARRPIPTRRHVCSAKRSRNRGKSLRTRLATSCARSGVPLDAGEQPLALHVGDHPLEYATFEGEIPKGEYGAGTVEIWDRGTYELLEEKQNGGLPVRLHGERLARTWA